MTRFVVDLYHEQIEVLIWAYLIIWALAGGVVGLVLANGNAPLGAFLLRWS